MYDTSVCTAAFLRALSIVIVRPFSDDSDDSANVHNQSFSGEFNGPSRGFNVSKIRALVSFHCDKISENVTRRTCLIKLHRFSCRLSYYIVL